MILKNARHEKFIQNIISGMSQRQAYLDAYPKASNWKENTIDSRASELFNSSKILGRYKELIEESKDSAILDRKSRMELLTLIAMDNKENSNARIKAIDTLNKMDGEYVTKLEVSNMEEEQSKLEELLNQRRKRRDAK